MLNANNKEQNISPFAIHDVRSTIFSISGVSNRISDDINGFWEGKKEFYDLIDAVSEYSVVLKGLLDDLIYLKSSQSIILEKKWVSLNDIINKSLDLTRPLSLASKVNIQTDIEDNLPEIHTISYRLIQILTNLINYIIKCNSIDSHITIYAKKIENIIHLGILDYSSGMSIYQINKILGNNIISNKGDMYKIITMIGGKINVKSSPRKGSDISIRFKGF